RRPLLAHRVDERAERQRRACGREDMDREGAGLQKRRHVCLAIGVAGLDLVTRRGLRIARTGEGDVENLSAEVVVIGGGPAGLTAAIAIAGSGIATALVAPRAPTAD